MECVSDERWDVVVLIITRVGVWRWSGGGGRTPRPVVVVVLGSSKVSNIYTRTQGRELICSDLSAGSDLAA